MMEDPEILEEKILEVIQTIYDPEIPVNIYELGLIYRIQVYPMNNAHVEMTLTAPNCPAAASLPAEIETKVKEIPGINDVKVEVVFEPPWDQSMMSEAAKLELGFL